MTGESTTTPRLPADFWRLWSASVVSRLGGGVTAAAAPLLAATVTRDPRLIALVSVASGLPWLLFALHTGALADRWDRRRTMVGCDLVSAVLFAVLAGLVLTDRGTLWVLCAVAFAAATVSTLMDSAGQAALPSIVPKPLLAVANSRLYTGVVLTGLFAGPPLGSWLFTQAPAVPFAVNAVSFAGSAVLVATIRTRFTAAPRTGTGLGTEIAEGVRWLWRHRQLRALVVLLTGVAVGGVLGALAAPRLERRIGTGRVLSLTVALTVLATAGLAVTRSAAVAVGLLAVVGAAAFAFNVVSVSYRQAVVPDRLLGRVSSAYRFATWGVAPVGAGLGGVVAAAAGVPAVFAGAAAVLAAVAVLALPRLTDARLDAARTP